MPVRETSIAKPSDKGSKFPRNWVVVDLDGQILGHAATEVATMLRGKNKPNFSPSVAMGDFVVAINASKIKMSGAKLDKKLYRHHTGYYGHVKSETARHYLARKPGELFRDAVWGMLPHNKLGRRLIHNLKVYAGDKHPHVAQAPKALGAEVEKVKE